MVTCLSRERERHRLLIAVSLVLVLVLAGCTGQPSDQSSSGKDSVKVGFLSPLSGGLSVLGQSAKRGTAVAAEEINQAGGIDGRQLEVVYEDSKGKAEPSVSAINKLISVDDVEGVVGIIMSRVATATYPIAERDDTIMMPAGVGAESMTNGTPLLYRVWMRDKLRAQKMAEKMVEKDIDRAAAIHVNSAWGLTMKEGFKNTFEKEGGSMTQVEAFNPGESDYSSQVTKIKNSDPEAIYIAAIDQAKRIIKEVRELNIDVPIFVAGELRALKPLLGGEAEGVIGTGFERADNDANKRFRQKFRAKFDKAPGPWAPYAYDALNILADSMERCGLNTEQIKTCLDDLESYKGATGVISFDEHGDAQRDIRFVQVRNGTIKSYE